MGELKRFVHVEGADQGRIVRQFEVLQFRDAVPADRSTLGECEDEVGIGAAQESQNIEPPSAAVGEHRVDTCVVERRRQAGTMGATAGGGWGYVARPGIMSHWPGGLCLCFPAAGSVNVGTDSTSASIAS